MLNVFQYVCAVFLSYSTLLWMLFHADVKIDWACTAALRSEELSVDLTAFQNLRQYNSNFNWLVMKQLF